jgi:hypothetical protein
MDLVDFELLEQTYSNSRLRLTLNEQSEQIFPQSTFDYNITFTC